MFDDPDFDRLLSFDKVFRCIGECMSLCGEQIGLAVTSQPNGGWSHYWRGGSGLASSDGIYRLIVYSGLVYSAMSSQPFYVMCGIFDCVGEMPKPEAAKMVHQTLRLECK